MSVDTCIAEIHPQTIEEGYLQDHVARVTLHGSKTDEIPSDVQIDLNHQIFSGMDLRVHVDSEGGVHVFKGEGPDSLIHSFEIQDIL